jgi:hypothetical protein
MIVSFLPKNKSNTQERIVHNMSKGAQGRTWPMDWWIRNQRIPSNTSRVITAGIIRGGGDLLKYLIAGKHKFYYMDHAYFKAGYNKRSEWMRVTADAFNCNKITDTNPTKFNKLFDRTFELKPWRRDGQTILILPPTDAVSYVFGSREWTNKVLETIRPLTSRQIIVRGKPGEVILDDKGKEIGRTPVDPTQLPLEQELSRAHCVIAYHSSVAIQAAIQGIPVICSEQCAAYPISNNIMDIEKLKEFDRMPWLFNLCNHQFETHELLSGSAWRYLEEERKTHA